MTKINSENVLYNLKKNGSITRSLYDKLNEFVSVKDFGAIGDGNNDDSDAIQKAVESFNERS